MTNTTKDLIIRLNIEAGETFKTLEPHEQIAKTAISKVICISSDIETVEELISWILQYNRGNFDEEGNVICEKFYDFKGCQCKAVALGLLPEVSSTEILKRRVI